MSFPIPSWTTIISSTSADVAALQTYITPVVFWVIAAILVVGVAGLMIGKFMQLAHGSAK